MALNSKGLCQSTGKEKESHCLILMFTSSKKRENWHFSHCSRAVTAKKSTKKCDVLLIQSYCLFVVLVAIAVDVA